MNPYTKLLERKNIQNIYFAFDVNESEILRYINKNCFISLDKLIYIKKLSIKKNCKLKKGDVVLDIGANDGTLLKYFKKDKMITIGCEPANNLQKELDLSYIFISHDMRVIKAIANKIIVLKDGLIVEENNSKDIFISPKSEYTKKLIASVI